MPKRQLNQQVFILKIFILVAVGMFLGAKAQTETIDG